MGRQCGGTNGPQLLFVAYTAIYFPAIVRLCFMNAGFPKVLTSSQSMVSFSSIWSRLTGGNSAKPHQGPHQGVAPLLQWPARPASQQKRVVQVDNTTGFRFPASDSMVGDEQSEQLLRIIKSFAPSQPTQNASQFASRGSILDNVIAAIEEHRNHLVIFGGRGTGKTSLALAMSAVARQVGYHTAYVSCSRESTLDSIFRSALADLSIRFDVNFDPRKEDADGTLRFDVLMPEVEMPPQALADILARVRGTRVLIVIDEFDRNEHPTLTRDLTEIMKVISDRAIPVQIVIVGVGDVVDNLVGEHASIARVLYVVRMSTMSDEEIRATVSLAASGAGMKISDQVFNAIIGVSYGRPYIARVVGLKACKMALLRKSSVVEIEDYRAGTEELLGYLNGAGFAQVGNLINSASDNISFFIAMLSCKRDSADRFSVSNIVEALNERKLTVDTTSGARRAVDIIASPSLGLLTMYPGDPPLYQFVDPRAELCVSILCGRILDQATSTPASNELPRAVGVRVATS